MGQRLDDWHLEAAEIMSGVRVRHDRLLVEDTSHREDRENAVTMMRHTATLVNAYASGGSGSTWSAWWSLNPPNRDGYLRLIVDRSRDRRASDTDMRAWEWELARYITNGTRLVRVAEGFGKEEPVRRLGVELSVSMSLAAAYTRRSLADLRSALEQNPEDPLYGVSILPHALLDLITANRPTV